MSRWDDSFEEHGAFDELRSAREQLDAAAGAVSGEQRESLMRIRRVLDHVERTLRASDPELVPGDSLDRIETTLGNLTTQLQQFVASPDDLHLSQANAHADALLEHAVTLAARTVPEDVQELQSAVSTFRRSAGQHLRHLEEEVGRVREKAAELVDELASQQAKIEAQDARLDSVVAEYQSQFSAAQEQRQTTFSQALEEARTELRASIEGSRAEIAAAVSEGKAELTTLLEQAGAASLQALTEAKQDAAAQQDEFKARGEERMKQLDELHAKAVKAVGAIGSTGMSGGYQIVANKERRSANLMRLLAVAALLCAIGATIYAVRNGVSGTFEVDKFFAKWALTIPFLALAGYAARESSKHREQETHNRRIELQLASLDAYLVSLTEAEQNKHRGSLVPRFFGGLGLATTEGAEGQEDERG